jgi:hypothetical protein
VAAKKTVETTTTEAEISPGVVPFIPDIPQNRPNRAETDNAYDPDKPICSLNIFCYRAGSNACGLGQIVVLLAKRTGSYQKQHQCRGEHGVVLRDQEFFEEIRRIYTQELCTIWRPWLSLKTLRGFRLLCVRGT